MLTNTMPSVVKALQKTLDPTTLKAFTQALGNCNQPVTQRGPVSVQPNTFYLRAGEYPTTNNSFGYNTTNYQQYNNYFQNNFNPIFGPFNPIFPYPQPPINIMPPDLGPGDVRIDLGDSYGPTINNNFNTSEFSFPTTQEFNYYEGPTNNSFAGDTYFQNTYINNNTTNTSNTTNLNVTNINGNPVEGPTGPPGQPGRDGRDGRDGAPGSPGMLVPVPFPIITPPRAPPPPPFPFGNPIDIQVPVVDSLKVYIPARTVEYEVEVFNPETCISSKEPRQLKIPEYEASIDAPTDVVTYRAFGPPAERNGQ